MKDEKQLSGNKITLRKEQVQLIEKLAVAIEKSGLQPAQAKIVSLLLVNDEPELTFDQIWETLSISKSAASAAINQLLAGNRIQYTSKIGDRKRYFSSRITSWQDEVKSQIEGMASFGQLLQEILAQRPARTKEFNISIKKLISFMSFLNKELPVLYKKFEQQNA